jgi:DNA-binding MarR family transcriptional regulator
VVETQTVGAPTDTENFGWALGTLLRAYLKNTAEAVAELPGGPRGFEVLATVYGGSCSNQASIAEIIGVDRTAMTYLLDDLESKGLVRRTPDPRDRRSRNVSLTDEGERSYLSLREKVTKVEQHLLAGLDADEAATLRATLSRAARSIDGASESTPCDLARDFSA